MFIQLDLPLLRLFDRIKVCMDPQDTVVMEVMALQAAEVMALRAVEVDTDMDRLPLTQAPTTVMVVDGAMAVVGLVHTVRGPTPLEERDLPWTEVSAMPRSTEVT
jgi:hypothetical protein